MHIRELVLRLFPEPQPTRLLFRVDAGAVRGLSYGHLMRCHRLARAASAVFGAGSVFLMARTAQGMDVARALGEDVISAVDVADRWNLVRGADTLVVDVPGGDGALMGQARKAGLRTVVLDDGGGCAEDVDTVLNYSVLAEGALYPHAARTLLGPDYCILSEEFEGLCRTPPDGPHCHVLVTFGGADPAGLTVRVATVLEASRLPLRATVVLGPGIADRTLLRLPDTSTVRYVRNPASLAALMAACDVAVAAGGLTLYELRALGVPTIAIASIEHEAPVVRAFAAKGELVAGLERWDGGVFSAVLAAAVTAALDSREG